MRNINIPGICELFPFCRGIAAFPKVALKLFFTPYLTIDLKMCYVIPAVKSVGLLISKCSIDSN